MDTHITFGGYISQKRRKNRRAAWETAKQIGITAAYLSDMETGKKTNPSREIMQKMIEVLCLDEEETALFYDLHAKANGIVSQDLPEYIMENDIARKAIRKAKKKPATDYDWQGFIDKLE
jgi:transcriptional regulator with XRE-family HTH domain